MQLLPYQSWPLPWEPSAIYNIYYGLTKHQKGFWVSAAI